MQYGAKPPTWALILQAAEDWGIPPWEIANGPAVWFERWKFYKGMAQQLEKAKHGKP